MTKHLTYTAKFSTISIVLFRYSQNKNGRPIKTAVIYTETEHCIKFSDIDPAALRTIKHLRDHGFEAYIVGGAVRDLLLGKVPKDFDLVTNATPSRIKKLFHNSRIIGKRFRIVHVFYGSTFFEVATFRSLSEGSLGNTFGMMDEDVRRRDFTVNALYYDPLKSHIIDYVGGVKDIFKKKIIPVIPLKQIFSDDPVRMLRAIKYACCTGFSIPFSVRQKIKKCAPLLATVSSSRLTEELLKIINSGYAHDIISTALQTGLYIYLQPFASSLVYENKNFAGKYFKSLKILDELHATTPNIRLGQKLVYLIYDFICSIADCEIEKEDKTAIGELYTQTWKSCRNFILPMNPQRTELEFAVRASLQMLGVPIRPQKKTISHPKSFNKKETQRK